MSASITDASTAGSVPFSRFDRTDGPHLSRWNRESSRVQPSSSDGESPVSSSRSNIVIQEFRPNFAHDPMFPVLEELFVRSFTPVYNRMHMSFDGDLREWLENIFDQERTAILAREHRCFTLSDRRGTQLSDRVLAFVTVREDESNSVYLAQLVVRQDLKRQGFGSQLVQHLCRTFPGNTRFWTIIRQRNQVASQFYHAMDATIIPAAELREKDGYDPQEYLGFEWRDLLR